MSKNIVQRQVWPCKDGYVFFAMLGGLTGAKTGRQLVKWMDAEGMGNEYLQTMDWENLDMGTCYTGRNRPNLKAHQGVLSGPYKKRDLR